MTFDQHEGVRMRRFTQAANRQAPSDPCSSHSYLSPQLQGTYSGRPHQVALEEQVVGLHSLAWQMLRILMISGHVYRTLVHDTWWGTLRKEDPTSRPRLTKDTLTPGSQCKPTQLKWQSWLKSLPWVRCRVQNLQVSSLKGGLLRRALARPISIVQLAGNLSTNLVKLRFQIDPY